MDKEIEFDLTLKGMRYDQLMMMAIRNGEHRRAIAISKRRHKALKKLIEKNAQKTKNNQEEGKDPVLSGDRVADEQVS